ncbi:MAG: cytochrome b/b6 domain-containing protein [Rhodocyclaceae bacterium]|nr:cytochrome b/b6 domain-containing protein [Rhodocyclaceae bacterium]
MNRKRIRLWDLPTRLFHWLLALCVAASIVSGQLGGNLIDWHGRIGVFVVGLIVFRLVWGLLGSTYARFAQFFPTPSKVSTYLRGEWQGLGHNPLGAFSVFGLLGLLAFQVFSGLFSNDDITFVGPLFDLVSKDLSNQLTGLHKQASTLLFILIGLHLAAIAFYGQVKKDNLIKPMISGWKEAEQGESAQGGGVLSLIFALIIAAAAVYGASGAWLPDQPPPPPAAETPSW